MTTAQDLLSATPVAGDDCAQGVNAAQAALCRLESRFDFTDLAILSQHFPLSRLWSVMLCVMVLSLGVTLVIRTGARRTPSPALNLIGINVFTTLSLILLVITGIGAYPIAWSIILLPAGVWLAVSVGVNGGHAFAMAIGAEEETLSVQIADGIHRAQIQMEREKLPLPLQALAKARIFWKPGASTAELIDPTKLTGLERAYLRWRRLPRWAQLAIVGVGLITAIGGVQIGQPAIPFVLALLVGGLWQGSELRRKAEAAQLLERNASGTPAPAEG